MTPPTDLSTVPEILAAEEQQLELIEFNLRKYVEQICGEIAIEIGDRHWFRFDLAESRLKRSKGVKRALANREFDPAQIWEIDDIVGVRVVVLTLPDARFVAERIMQKPPRLQLLERHNVSEPSGYRAIHVKGWSEANAHPVGCEIQVRTAVQDAWAIVSRHDIYGNETVAEHVKRTARIIADQLAAVDASFELIQDEARRAERANDLCGERETRTTQSRQNRSDRLSHSSRSEERSIDRRIFAVNRPPLLEPPMSWQSPLGAPVRPEARTTSCCAQRAEVNAT